MKYNNLEVGIVLPIRTPNLKGIECMVRGQCPVDVDQIKNLRHICTDNDVTTQIQMNTGESYYIRGKDMHQVADELGLVLGPTT